MVGLKTLIPIWDVIRDGFLFENVDQDLTEDQLTFLTKLEDHVSSGKYCHYLEDKGDVIQCKNSYLTEVAMTCPDIDTTYCRLSHSKTYEVCKGYKDVCVQT